MENEQPQQLQETAAEEAISPEQFQAMLKEACLIFDREMQNLHGVRA